jgi:hypothetical protein
MRLRYCTILINLTHRCDCDMLDWFNPLTPAAGDCDRVQNSTQTLPKLIFCAMFQAKLKLV